MTDKIKTATADLLLEIGVEELPASYITPALQQMEKALVAALAEERLEHGKIKTFGTPRRLAVLVKGLSERGADQRAERIGPRESAAFDEKGAPTRAAEGFARKYKIPIKQLQTREVKGAKCLFVEEVIEGRLATEILGSLLAEKVILKIKFPKSMYWEKRTGPFARPVRWLCALYGQSAVKGLSCFGLQGDNVSCGSRFTHSGPVKLTDAGSYVEALRKAGVIVAVEERRELVRGLVEKEAVREKGMVYPDKELLDIVTNLVECPLALTGGFDKKFLELPEVVVRTAMKEHQKYFTLVRDGVLLPRFVTVINEYQPAAGVGHALVIQGHERVLRARLADAVFYWQEDMKTSLVDRAELLKDVVWMEGMGSIAEKSERLVSLTEFLLAYFPSAKRNVALEIAGLCKADLTTEMIRDGKEFTKLQGIIGGEYARAQKLPEKTAQGIAEHYLPRTVGDRLPDSAEAVLVSIADKVDNLVGCFAQGLKPTGSADPYALRRQALAVIELVRGCKLSIGLGCLVATAKGLFAEKAAKFSEDEVIVFVLERLSVMLREKGVKHDIVEAVLGAAEDDLLRVEGKCLALGVLSREKNFKQDIFAFSRVMNILKKDVDGKPKEQLFKEKEEKDLYQSLLNCREKCQELLAVGSFLEVFRQMSGMRGAIDGFFEQVLVMDKDEQLKHNRLALLNEIKKFFFQFADFSKIIIEGDER